MARIELTVEGGDAGRIPHSDEVGRNGRSFASDGAGLTGGGQEGSGVSMQDDFAPRLRYDDIVLARRFEMDDLALDHRLVGAIYHGVLDPSAYAEIARFFETTVVDRLVDRPPDDLRGVSAVSEVLQHLSRTEHIFDLSNRGPSRNLGQLLEAQPYVAFAVTTAGRIVRANPAAEATLPRALRTCSTFRSNRVRKDRYATSFVAWRERTAARPG